MHRNQPHQSLLIQKHLAQAVRLQAVLKERLVAVLLLVKEQQVVNG
jgi:hypothetical protein